MNHRQQHKPHQTHYYSNVYHLNVLKNRARGQGDIEKRKTRREGRKERFLLMPFGSTIKLDTSTLQEMPKSIGSPRWKG
jgi:hypothetical protein